MTPRHYHLGPKWHSAWGCVVVIVPPILDTSLTSSCHPLGCGTLPKDIIVHKGRVKNARNGWAIGVEILAFSVIISEIYRSQGCKDTSSITLYGTEFKTPSFIRCTFVLRTIKKEKSLPAKLWYAMDCELHFNFRHVKMWKKCVPWNQWTKVFP